MVSYTISTFATHTLISYLRLIPCNLSVNRMCVFIDLLAMTLVPADSLPRWPTHWSCSSVERRWSTSSQVLILYPISKDVRLRDKVYSLVSLVNTCWKNCYHYCYGGVHWRWSVFFSPSLLSLENRWQKTVYERQEGEHQNGLTL